MRKFPERLTEQRRPTLNWVEPSCGLESQMEEGQVSWASASISLCFQTADAMWPVTSHSFCHASPIMLDHTLKLQPKQIFPYIAFCQVSCHSYETRNRCTQCGQLSQASEWVGVCPQNTHHTVSRVCQPSRSTINVGRVKPPTWVSHTRSPPP